MVASGLNANVTGTSWALMVGADSVAELVVDRGGMIVLTNADTTGGRTVGTDTIIARPERMYRWKNGELLVEPPGVDPFSPAETQYWSDIIDFNSEDLWEGGGGFPWVVVPVVVVPVLLCLILCGGDDDGGKTGTVTIPIP